MYRKKETVYEISDLVYHVMVMMIEMGISLEDIQKELAFRHVIDHKVKQEKMTESMKGNLHTHTTYCDGNNSPEEMVLDAISAGFNVLGFSGHSYTLLP